jgi:hypothetical protein
VIGRSRPRGPGTQASLAGAGTGVGILTVPFLTVAGEAMGGGREGQWMSGRPMRMEG